MGGLVKHNQIVAGRFKATESVIRTTLATTQPLVGKLQQTTVWSIAQQISTVSVRTLRAALLFHEYFKNYFELCSPFTP